MAKLGDGLMDRLQEGISEKQREQMLKNLKILKENCKKIINESWDCYCLTFVSGTYNYPCENIKPDIHVKIASQFLWMLWMLVIRFDFSKTLYPLKFW